MRRGISQLLMTVSLLLPLPLAPVAALAGSSAPVDNPLDMLTQTPATDLQVHVRDVPPVRLAAIQNGTATDAAGMWRRAVAYRDGIGTAPDKIRAYAWAALAQQHGADAGLRRKAARLTDDLALLLLPDEIATARQMALDWHPGAELTMAVPVGDDPLGAADRSFAALPDLQFTAPGYTQDKAAPEDINHVERHYAYDVTLAPDGTATAVTHLELQVSNAASIDDIAQISLSYDNTLDEFSVIDAYTLKADGRHLAVDPAAIMTQHVPSSQGNLMFDDQREKVIIFPDVDVGDTVVYTTRTVSKPLLPGYYGNDMAFDPAEQEDDVSISYRVPKGMQLFTESHGVALARSSEGAWTHYSWRYQNPQPLGKTSYGISALDRWPRIFVATQASYREFVTQYAGLIAAAPTVTADVQKLADELTAGITDRRQQAQRLYEWVSGHIRYVGLELGYGGIIPHNAAKILRDRYGDCKDHSILYVSLLRAKGIAAEPVLINSGRRASLSMMPTMWNFDHMITYIPEFDLYADTTVGLAPFGVLTFAEYGKPVVHVPLDDAAKATAVVRRIPALMPDQAEMRTQTNAKLAPNGKLTGTSATVASGPFGIELREDALDIQSTGGRRSAEDLLDDRGYDGTGHFQISSPRDLSPSYRIDASFETKSYGDLVKGGDLRLPRGLVKAHGPGLDLMGRRGFAGAVDEPIFCRSGHEIETLTLDLPPGKKPKKLPEDHLIENAAIRFTSRWSFADHRVTVIRDYRAQVAEPLCVAALRELANDDLQEIDSVYDESITLTDD
jgi:transglutaminase-like putative cysteine protease